MKKKPPKRPKTETEITRQAGKEMEKGTVLKKTSIELPLMLWVEAKTLAAQKQKDLREIIIEALGQYVRSEMEKESH